MSLSRSDSNPSRPDLEEIPDSAPAVQTIADRAAQSGTSDRTQRMADKVAKSDPELAKKVGLGEVSFPDAVAQVTGKPKKAALIPKVKEPIDDEGADQDDSVEALLSANAQLKEDNETLHRAAGIEDIPV